MSLKDLLGVAAQMMSDVLSTPWLYARVYMLRIFGAIIGRILRFVIGIPRPTFSVRARVHPEGDPLRCEVYVPSRYFTTRDNRFPAYVNLHGGAFVAGSPKDDGEFCAFIARECECVVISLGYRLAPEYQHPAAVDDAAAAVAWLKREDCPLRINPSHIALGGFSAGATIAAAASTIVKADITSVVNFYSIADLTFAGTKWYDFMGRIAKEAYVPKDLQGKDLTDPLMSPMHGKPSAFPAHLVSLIPKIDPHQEENLALALKLAGNSGKRSTHRVYEGVRHGWTHVPKYIPFLSNDKVKWEAFCLVAAELKKAWK